MSEMKDEEWFETWFDTKYYHSLYQHRDDTEAAYFIARLLEELDIPSGSLVMDLACGKGRHSLRLFDAGYHVTGLDLSRSSITHAKKDEKEGLSFHQWDMRDRYTSNEFEGVFNLFTSFGYFDDKQDNLRVLDAVSYALKPGGVFILDYLNAIPLLDEQPHEEHEIARDGYVFRTCKQIKDGRVIKDIEVVDGEKNLLFSESVQLFTLEDFKEMFEQSDLALERVWGDYKLGPYHPEESPRMILKATKK